MAAAGSSEQRHDQKENLMTWDDSIKTQCDGCGWK
jgi:hypothetical protein